MLPGTMLAGKCWVQEQSNIPALLLVAVEDIIELLVAAMGCDVNRVTTVQEIPLIMDTVHSVTVLYLITQVVPV